MIRGEETASFLHKPRIDPVIKANLHLPDHVHPDDGSTQIFKGDKAKQKRRLLMKRGVLTHTRTNVANADHKYWHMKQFTTKVRAKKGS